LAILFYIENINTTNRILITNNKNEKKFKLLALGIILFIAGSTRAQVSVNVNIGPPSWGPSGYAETEYYLPDVQAYYDIRASQFIYFGSGN
jgi:hypothetical protein